MNLQLLNIKQSLPECQAPELSPVIKAALSLGWEVSESSESILLPPRLLLPGFETERFKKGRFPCGHRYYHDCLREQEARLLGWAIRIHHPGCWFVTHTFKYAISVREAERLSGIWLGRLNQAHQDFTGGAPLRSATTMELQHRDVVHYHHLIFGYRLDAMSRKSWENRWQVISGGFAANYTAELKAAPYLVKHQSRSSDGNLNLGGCWRGINPPRSVSACCDQGRAAEASVGSQSLYRVGVSRQASATAR